MPRQGQSVESCIITKWHFSEGDSVNEGDVLFEYETDKSAFEEESQVSGKILRILCEEDDDVPCLDVVCVIGEEGEDISEFIEDEKESSADKAETAAEVKKEEEIPTAAETTGKSDERKVSPRARMIASQRSLDLSRANPTGPDGRIIERDVMELARKGYVIGAVEEKPLEEPAPAAAAAAVEEAEYEDIPHSNVRKVIAKSMHQSLSNMAQLTFNRSFDCTEIINDRNSLKASADALGLANITFNDIVMYAVSRTLKDYPRFNAHYDDEKLRVFKHVHLGMAVDTPRGLLVPTIFNADEMSLNEISLKSKELGAQASEGRISPDLLTGATFTVSNLGALGIESFTPIVNPPQTAILGVNTLEDRIRVVDGEVVPYKAMNLSLTCDHRAVDGADAARILKDLCTSLENFSALLAR